MIRTGEEWSDNGGMGENGMREREDEKWGGGWEDKNKEKREESEMNGMDAKGYWLQIQKETCRMLQNNGPR